MSSIFERNAENLFGRITVDIVLNSYEITIFFGMSIDDSLDDVVELKLIATGLKHDRIGLPFVDRFRNLIPGL